MNNAKALQIIRKTRAIYNTIAREWDTSRFGPSRLKNSLLKGLKSGCKALDIGCGNGMMAGPVLARGARYYGLDISAKLIAIARKKNRGLVKTGRAKFVVGDALKLPYKNNFFDFIFSFAVWHHIPSEKNRVKFLAEIFRVLKPGGTAVVVNWNLNNPWPKKRFKIAEQLKNPAPGFDPGDVQVPWKATKEKILMRYLHLFSDSELRRLIKMAGGQSYRIEYQTRDGKKKKNGEEQVIKFKKHPV
ncbi:MAG: methyltransferase domain-containing protein [Patescibacteria group bacterium]|nr:methyltransferase domain-containing protein [Patescibacteria group bacterium]